MQVIQQDMDIGPLSMHKHEEGTDETAAWPKSLSMVSSDESGRIIVGSLQFCLFFSTLVK